MRHLVVSLSYNQIKLTAIDKNGLSSIQADVSPEIFNGSTILDANGVTQVIKDLLLKLNVSVKNSDLTFTAEPESVFLRFITLPKHAENTDEVLVNEIKTKFPEYSLEDSYFGYEKIAPFVYQFTAVKKTYLENIIKVSDLLGLPLVAVVPWVCALPKYVNTKEASIFITGDSKEETITLSELGGVFFSDKYSTSSKKFDLEKTVKELSVYRKDKPIKTIYSLNYNVPEMEDGFTVKKIEFNLGEGVVTTGYEHNLLAHFILDANEDLDENRTNLINLLPLPALEKKPLSIAKVGVATTALVVVSIFVLVITGVIGGKAKPDSNALAAKPEDSTVLSTQDSAPQQQAEQPQAPAPEPQLTKSDLTIRVENGSGINGMAAKTQKLLEEKTYKVASIGTSETSSDVTILKFKSDKAAFEKLVKEDLADKFGEIKVETTLEDSADYDLLITIGSGVKL